MSNDAVKIKPDVILVWPSCFDYPLCRWQLDEYRSYFGRMIISSYYRGEPNYFEFLTKSIPQATFLKNDVGLGDPWPACVESALEKVRSDYILFLDQGFFFKGEYFLHRVFKALKENDLVGIRQGNQLSPSFLLAKKDQVLEIFRTVKYQDENKDYFSLFSAEILKLSKFISLFDLGLFDGVDWYYFSFLNSNLQMIRDGDVRKFHEPIEFLIYNYLSRTRRVSQDASWVAFTYYAETLLSKFGRFLSP